jgi:hypothetical protein
VFEGRSVSRLVTGDFSEAYHFLFSHLIGLAVQFSKKVCPLYEDILELGRKRCDYPMKS